MRVEALGSGCGSGIKDEGADAKSPGGLTDKLEMLGILECGLVHVKSVASSMDSVIQVGAALIHNLNFHIAAPYPPLTHPRAPKGPQEGEEHQALW